MRRGCFRTLSPLVETDPNSRRSVPAPSRSSSSPTCLWSPAPRNPGEPSTPGQQPSHLEAGWPRPPHRLSTRSGREPPSGDRRCSCSSAGGAAFLLLLYFAIGAELYGLSALIVGVGCPGAALLSYPLLITLERPVRITPEQAARDYFAALSHHLPHYRRMWLLLSARGRVSPQFASYEGFKNYWVKRLEQFREGHAGRFSPLVFNVEEFRAEKNAGKTKIDARFKMTDGVRPRTGQRESPAFHHRHRKAR